MRFQIFGLLATLSLSSMVKAQGTQPLWAQCGGIGWNGGTTCTAGAECKTYNDYYSQCIPSLSTTTTTSTTASSSSRTSSAPSSTTSGCFLGKLRPRATGLPIVASTPDTPVYGLQLGNSGGKAALLRSGYSTGYSSSGGGLGALYWSTACYYYMYLNIETSTSSYKPLTWNRTMITTDWVQTTGSPLSTKPTSPYAGTSDFLACGDTLYLQTGLDVPANQTCVLTKLQMRTYSV